MIAILIMLFFMIIIEILIIALLFSNIVLDVEKCDIWYDEKIKNKIEVQHLKVSIKVYIFRKIRILSIKLHRNYCEIFKIKIKLNLLKKLKEDKQSGIMFVIKNIGKLKPKVKKINLKLDIGTEDLIITTFLVPIISTVLSIYITRNLEVTKERKMKQSSNYKLKITPQYLNKNNFKLLASGQISFDLLNTLFFIKKHKAIKA